MSQPRTRGFSRGWPWVRGDEQAFVAPRSQPGNEDGICSWTMCRQCVKQEFPDRGTICQETGSYLLNFEKCKACGKKVPVKIIDKSTQEDEYEEIVTYKHVCSCCNHIIAEHEYTFTLVENYQEYQMACMLCGSGADSVSVLPV